MPFPTINEYATAMLLPAGRRPLASPALDPVNAGELLRPPPPSRHLHWGAGTFAVVYRYRAVGGREWALRCIISEPPSDLAIRYGELQRYLDRHKVIQRYFVDTQYVGGGITVANRAYPVFLMEWVEGRTIGRKVEEFSKAGDRRALRVLASQWYRAVCDLQGAGIAHGDIQHGNIMVTTAGTLRLVDYDTVYVPALAGRKATAVGTAGYAHPLALASRKSEFDARMDTFGSLVVLVSLLALAEDPARHGRYSKDNLFFSANDLEHSKSSAAFRELGSSRDPELARLARQLQNLCSTAPRMDLAFSNIVGSDPGATGAWSAVAQSRPAHPPVSRDSAPASTPPRTAAGRLPAGGRASVAPSSPSVQAPTRAPQAPASAVTLHPNQATFAAVSCVLTVLIATALPLSQLSALHNFAIPIAVLVGSAAVFGWAAARVALGIAQAFGTPLAAPVVWTTLGASLGGFLGVIALTLAPDGLARNPADLLAQTVMFSLLGAVLGGMFMSPVASSLGIWADEVSESPGATQPGRYAAVMRVLVLWLMVVAAGSALLHLETPSETILRGHDGDVLSVAVSGHGKYVVSGGRDRSVRFWDVAARRPVRTWTEHRDAVRTVAMTQRLSRQTVLSGSYDGTIRIWDPKYDRSVARVNVGEGGVQSLALSSLGSHAAAGCTNGTVVLFDWRAGKILVRDHPSSAPIRSIALSHTSSLLAAASGTGEHSRVFIYRVSPEGTMERLYGDRHASGPLAFSRDSALLASGDGELITAATGRSRRVDLADGTDVRGIFFSMDDRLVGGVGWSGGVILQKVSDQYTRSSMAWRRLHRLPPTVRDAVGRMQYAFSDDRATVATGNDRGEVVVVHRPPLGPWIPE